MHCERPAKGGKRPTVTLRPAEVDADDAVELAVERPEEIAQSLQHSIGNLGMRPTFRLAETMRLYDSIGSRRRPHDTRKSLDGIELKVGLVDDGM